MKAARGSYDHHAITPAEGSARRPDGRPASLLDPTNYPVLATCAECGRAVRCERFFLAGWEHLEDEPDEPYCVTCGAAVGIFQGQQDQGWQHYRGGGTAASPAEIYDAGHAPEVAWRPAGEPS